MSKPGRFLVSPNRVDWLTLGSLLLSAWGLWSALRGYLTLAVSLMLLAMLVDMFDGVLARRLGLASDFGRYLDSFCDVFTYLALPLFVLYQLGLRDPVSGTALFIFLTSGLLRLSRFNMIGTVEDRGVQYHRGLQVVWSQLLVVLAFPAWYWLGGRARYALIPALLLMSLFMVLDIRVRKPTRYRLYSVLILAVGAWFAYLHWSGVRVP